MWEKKLTVWIKKNYPRITIVPLRGMSKSKRNSLHLLIVLGGDGTILEAAQKYYHVQPLLVGLNLGRIGFLASIRRKKDFFEGLNKIFQKKYRILPRMMLRVTLVRKGRQIFSGYSLNDVTVQNLLGMTALSLYADDHPIQSIYGTGVLVSTATGSTAYNLSAHGPIVMPDIKCMIITEILDHNIPTPSVIIKRNRVIKITVDDFRPTKRFIATSTGEHADVVLAVDSAHPIPLKKGDKIYIKKSERLIRFIEVSKHYFFESLREKLMFH